ncbi:MAG: 50S ribosomal protein L29 [Rickettsiales bacterium]|nr:MAG: 50S ribosomal protein L29 [Rickettsiales bacterium]
MSKSEFTSKVLSQVTLEKLVEKLVFLKKELFNLRFQKTLGELTNTSRFLKVKKDIARVGTELTRRRKTGAKADA